MIDIQVPVKRARANPAPRVAKFAAMLKAFYAEYRPDAGDLVRFEKLLDQMFDVFRQASAECDNLGWCWPKLRTADNLDTGNASMPAYEPFVRQLEHAYQDRATLRGYVGPRPLPELTDAVRNWLVAAGVVDPDSAARLGVAVGSGTVNLWDSTLRVILEEYDDLTLLHDVPYGFFMPQSERRGARMAVLKDQEWATRPEIAVGGWVDEYNDEREAFWRRTLVERCSIYASGFTRDATKVDYYIKFARDLKQRRDLGVTEIFSLLANASRYLFFDGDPDAFADAQSKPGVRLARPGRVRVFLLISPNTYGYVYSQSQVDALAHTLHSRGVVLVEDWAYHSLGTRVCDIATTLGRCEDTLMLFGLSKPLGIADCRIGLLFGSPVRLNQIYRSIENSIGFVSTRMQLALTNTLRHHADDLSRQCDNNWQNPSGYLDQLSIALACLRGFNELSEPERMNWARGVLVQITEDAQDSLAEALRLHGADLRPQVEGFLRVGLSKYFTIREEPRAGFFVVVDCGPILERPPSLLATALTNSFDVFAALAYFFGVRTIPEECMGNLGFERGRLLRISYSVDTVFLLRALFTVYCGFQLLESLEDSQGALFN